MALEKQTDALGKRIFRYRGKTLEELKKENKGKYDSFEVKFEQDSLKLFGVKKITEKKEGLGGNLKYFKTSFLSSGSTDKDKINLTHKAVDMLCLRENTFYKVKTTNQYKIFKNQDKYTAIIFEHKGISPFIKYIEDIDGVINTYIFTLSDDNFEEEFDNLLDAKSKDKYLQYIMDSYEGYRINAQQTR